VTQTVSQTATGNTQSPPPRLLELLESGGLDWDDPRHREAYLRAWVSGSAPRKAEENEQRP